MATFNEDTRVKIPATIQFLRIGYDYQSLKDADIDFQTKIFINRFKPALEEINERDFSYDEVKEILMDINNVIKNNDLGKEFYNWLINPLDKVKLIDFEDISKNNFAVIDEFPYCVVEGTEEGSFRPDINILINGMPLSFLEVKKPNNDGGIQKEFDRMINQRLKNPEYKKFFNMLQFISFSNNMEYEDADDAEDVKAGSFYTTPNGQNTSFSFFREDDEMYHLNYSYKEITADTIKYIMCDCGYNPAEADTPEFKENLQTYTPCNSFITSVFDKERFLYFLHYGMMFVDGKVPEKHIMRYPQFFATRKIIERLENGGKGGIIWHTQGSHRLKWIFPQQEMVLNRSGANRKKEKELEDFLLESLKFQMQRKNPCPFIYVLFSISFGGSGFRKILDSYEFQEHYTEDMKPKFKSGNSDFWLILKNLNYGAKDIEDALAVENTDKERNHLSQNGQDMDKMIISFCREPKSIMEIMDYCGLKSRTSFRRNYLQKMLEDGILKMTIPNKPSSRNQKYYS